MAYDFKGYNYNSGSGGETHAPALQGLVKSGADLLKNMYDVRIFFPGANGKPEETGAFNYPVTVRASGVAIPEVGVQTYEIKYHGNSVKRPSGQIEFNREITIEFREDAAFELRARFTEWLAAVGDPVTGGISNSTNFYGSLEVATITGDYYAPTTVFPSGSSPSENSSDKQILASDGTITSNYPGNQIAAWKFYHVWVSKVGGIDFSTDATDPNKFSVTFQFMDCDMPVFGGNTFIGEGDTRWTGSSSK